MESTLSEVLKYHELTENDLNKPCPRNVRRSIAMKLVKWELLAHFLGLSEGDRADIKKKDDHQLQCLECLERWHKNCGSKATYLELVKCLLEIKHRDLAEELCKLYIATKSDGVCQDAKGVSAIKGQIDHLEEQSDGACQDAKPVTAIKDQIDHFEERFEKLATAALDNIENQGDVTVEKLWNDLTLLPTEIKLYHVKYLKESISYFVKASNLREAFLYLNLYWDYFNYTLLEVIINKYGSETLKKNMESYVADLHEFWEKTTVADFIPYYSKSIEEYPDTNLLPKPMRMKIKYEKNKHITLMELDELKRSFHLICQLPDFAMILYKITEGCLEVTWLVTTELGECLKKELRREKIHHSEKEVQQQILSVTVGDYCVYNRESGDETTVTPSKKNFIKMLYRKVQKMIKKDLISLCKYGDYEAVKQLLEDPAVTETVDVDIRDNKNWTPLMWACEKGNYEIVKLLIQQNANVNVRSKNGWTPLHIACSKKFVKIIELLLENRAECNAVINPDTNFTALMWISDLGYVEVARTLLDHGADVEMAIADNGWTPLIQATHYRQRELVKLYLEYRADPNRQVEKGWTALMEAARRNEREIAEMLIENGAHTELVMKDAKELTGEQALHVASYMGSADVVKILMEHGADVNATNEVGLTGLMLAIGRGNKKVTETLIESRAIDINLPHKESGLPAIFLAAKKGHKQICKVLLRHGARTKVDSLSLSDVAPVYHRRAINIQLKQHKMQVQAKEQTQDEVQTIKMQEEIVTQPVSEATIIPEDILHETVMQVQAKEQTQTEVQTIKMQADTEVIVTKPVSEATIIPEDILHEIVMSGSGKERMKKFQEAEMKHHYALVALQLKG